VVKMLAMTANGRKDERCAVTVAVILAAILCDPELAKFRRMFLLIVRLKGVRHERDGTGTGFLAARRTRKQKQFAVGAAALLLLFVGIHNAWDAVTYHIFVKESGRE
jgi:hypothetical protein